MRYAFKVITAIFISSVFSCASVWAQGGTAQISGTVRDQSGAVLPGAEVTATQTATGLVRTMVTNETGSYVLANLPVGAYRLEAVLPGFRTYVQTGIVLQVDASSVINPVLEIGQVSEQVQVEANATLVETQTSGLGTVIDNQRVLELPLNGRNPIELVVLSGQATIATNAGGMTRISGYPTIGLAVAGGIANQVLYLLDGAHHNDTHTGLGYPLPFPDALQEFKVETSAIPAQYGYHAAATVNAVTKAGTNELHGDMFEFVRNGVFNARDFFASTRDTLKRNQFGGVVGGPILKNKLFFFAGYQSTLQRSDPASTIAYVPTPAMLRGDFTAIASPACNGGRQINLAASQGFVNNQISPSNFDPVALKLTSLFPVPTGPCGQVKYGLRSDQNDRLGVARMDYHFSDRHSLFGRLLIDNVVTPTTYDGKNPLSISLIEVDDRIYSLVLGDTYLIGSNLISTFRMGANRQVFESPLDQCGCSWPELGARNVVSLGEHAPLLTVGGGGGSGFVIGGGPSTKFDTYVGPNPNFAEDLSLIKGSHQVGFGVNYLYQLQNFLWGNKAPGSMTVSGQVTGMPLADFLLGNASAWNQGQDNRYYHRQHHLGMYVQDSWKVSSRFRVNYGVRWEPYLPISSKNGHFAHFTPGNFAQNIHSSVYVNGPAGLIFPGDTQYTAGKQVQANQWSEFFPRIGLVWDPAGDGRMTIRAAYGMLADQQHMGSGHVTFANDPPFGNAISLANVKMSDPWATYPGGNPFPLTLSKDITFPTLGQYRVDPLDLKAPYVHEWNLSVQRQVGNDWLLTANYTGSSTIHQSSSVQLNPAVFLGLGPCTINGVNYAVCSTTANTNQRRVLFLQNPDQGRYYAQISEAAYGTASYNALFLSAQKRLGRGVSVLANHTWSHCISDIWDIMTSVSLNLPGQRRLNRGNCLSGDQRHIFNLSAVVQTPRFSNETLRRIGTGWQLSPIMKIRSAQFFTVTTGVDNELNGQANQVPNLIPGVSPYAADQTVDHWLNPAAFAVPALGTRGNLARNSLKGPGTFQLDVALSRSFAIQEPKSLQLRAEAFNILNHPAFSPPVATLNSGAFGQILSDISGNSGLSAGNPRILQFALKLMF